MLELLRQSVGGWIAKIFIGLLVISFAVWGVSDVFIGGAGNAVISVGETRVSPVDYRLAYDQQVNGFSRQLGRPLNREEARSLGVEANVLNQLVAGAVLDETARRMGLGLSDDHLAGLIGDDEAFHDASGQFSRDQLALVLRRVGMGEEDYVRNRQAFAVRSQIIEGVSAGAQIPQAFIDAYDVYRNQRRRFEYVTIGTDALDQAPSPSPSDLSAYYDANRETYVAPEYRQLAIVKLEAEDIADPEALADEEVAAAYEERKAGFTEAERRNIQQLSFTDPAQAQAASDRLKAGELFETVMADLGQDPAQVDLGFFAKRDLPDINLADAAFTLPLNEPSDVVEGIFGPVIMRIIEIQPERTLPLSEVEDELREDLALSKAADELFDAFDRLEDERAAGDTLAEAAGKLGLGVRVIDAIDQAGNAPDGTALADIPEQARLLAEAFQTGEGVETDALPIGSAGFVWYEVRSVTPERQKPLDEVEAQVREAWIAAETTAQIREIADALRERIDRGGDFAGAAAEMLPVGTDGEPVTPQTSAEMTRIDSSPELPNRAVEAGFGAAKGKAVVAHGAGDVDQVVLRVADIIAGSGAAIETQERSQLDDAVANDLLGQLVNDLREQETVSINRQAIEAALTLSGTSYGGHGGM